MRPSVTYGTPNTESTVLRTRREQRETTTIVLEQINFFPFVNEPMRARGTHGADDMLSCCFVLFNIQASGLTDIPTSPLLH